MVVIIYQFVNWTLLKAFVKYDSFNYSEYSKKGAIASSIDDNFGVISDSKDAKPSSAKIGCKICLTVFADLNLLFTFSMLIAAVLGTFLHPGIFAINLSLFIRENRLLRYVLKSAVDHYDQLIITIVLGLIVLYWYSSLTFYSDWRGEYSFEDRINC